MGSRKAARLDVAAQHASARLTRDEVAAVLVRKNAAKMRENAQNSAELTAYCGSWSLMAAYQTPAMKA
jgi:hypothetical protein